MSNKPLRTTPEEFERFKTEAQRLATILGLQDWDIGYEHKRLPKHDVAQYHYDCIAHSGVMVFNTLKRTEHDNPEQAAKHECGHALLAPLQELAESRFVTQREVSNAVEAIVVKLEKIL